MKQSIEPKRLASFLKLLGILEELEGELLAVVQAKIDAMRKADVEGLHRLGAREQSVVKSIQNREGLRRQMLDSIGEQLGRGGIPDRGLSISQLASRLVEAQSRVLLQAGESLRAVVFQVARANRVAGAVSRDVLNHLKWVFASVKPRGEEPLGYSGDGALHVPASGMKIFEAVG